MKYDKDFSAYIRDVSDRLDGVSAGIRAETIKKLAGRWREFDKERDALDKEDANMKDKFTTLVDSLHNDTGIAIREAREQHLKEPDIPRPQPKTAIKATEEQIDQWGNHLRGTLTEKHRKATDQIEQRHKLDLEKVPDQQKLRIRHFNERSAFEDRKRFDRDNLELTIASARAAHSIPVKFYEAAHMTENLDDWAARQQEALKERHHNQLEKLHAAYYENPETQASITQWERDLFALETAQEAERRDLDQTIAAANETGRIPDREPPGFEQRPGMER